MHTTTVTTIYGLVDPRDGQVFYVGRTNSNLRHRLIGHLSQSRVSDSPKGIYIREMVLSGLKPEIIEIAKLENATKKEAIATESAWIEFYGLRGELKNSGAASHGMFGLETATVLPDWVIEALGTMPDQKLGDMAGISKSTICENRRSRGIPATRLRRKEVDWTPEKIAKLGVVGDRELAIDLSCSLGAVRSKRHLLGIPPKPEEKQMFVWTNELIALLCTMPDAQLAREIGVPVQFISKKRRLLGISKSEAWNRLILPSHEIDQLGKEPDYKIAKRNGVQKTCVRQLRLSLGIDSYQKANEPVLWTNEYEQLLGIISDKHLSQLLGCELGTVSRARKKRGIPKLSKKGCNGKTSKATLDFWTEEKVILLGTMPDTVLAIKFDCTETKIRYYRQKLKIESYTKSKS